MLMKEEQTTPPLHSLQTQYGRGWPAQPIRSLGRRESSGELDEAVLLDETEQLLEMLDHSAFVDPSAHSSAASSHSINPSHGSDVGTGSSKSGGVTGGIKRAAVAKERNPLSGAPKVSRRRGSKPGSMRNPSRERMMNELEYLREQVAVLEAALQSAQDRKVSFDSAGAQEGVSMTTTMASKWEQIAKRQLDKRERAVAENNHLHNMLAVQREHIAGLEEALYGYQYAAPHPIAILNHTDNATAVSKSVRLEPGDEMLFDMLASELDMAYLKIDETFRDAGMDKLADEAFFRLTPKTQVLPSGAHRSFVELVDIHFWPFDLKTRNRVADDCCERQCERADCLLYVGNWDPERVFATKSCVRRVLNGEELRVNVLMVLKEFVFDNRVAVVWRSMYKCEDRFPGAYVQESGSFVASSVKMRAANTGGTPREGTIERTCVQFEPKRFAAPSSSHVVSADVDAMTDLVLSVYHDDMEELVTMMEDTLLKESRTRAAV